LEKSYPWVPAQVLAPFVGRVLTDEQAKYLAELDAENCEKAYQAWKRRPSPLFDEAVRIVRAATKGENHGN